MSNPVVFRCKRSGNCVKFSNENDIAELRKHESYEEVLPNAIIPKQIEKPIAKEPPKRGRPRKE